MALTLHTVELLGDQPKLNRVVGTGISDLDFQLAHRGTPSTLDARNM